jgi:hypothetical protein
MKPLIALGVVAVATTVALGAQAQTTRNLDLTNRHVGTIKLNSFPMSCQVSGTPAEFPNDLVFTNTGKVTIPRYRTIQWQTSAPRYMNRYRLKADLAPGASIRADNVLPGGIEAGKPCTAKVI